MPAKADLQVAAEMTAKNSPSSLILSQDSYLDQLMRQTQTQTSHVRRSHQRSVVWADGAFVQAAGQPVLLVSEKGHFGTTKGRLFGPTVHSFKQLVSQFYLSVKRVT